MSLNEANPKIAAFVESERRSFRIYGFPYLIVYQVIASEIFVLVVRHQSRDPNFASKRAAIR